MSMSGNSERHNLRWYKAKHPGKLQRAQRRFRGMGVGQSICRRAPASPAGTGTDFGVFGGPRTKPSGYRHRYKRNIIFSPPLLYQDPLATVTPPPMPWGSRPAKQSIGQGCAAAVRPHRKRAVRSFSRDYTVQESKSHNKHGSLQTWNLLPFTSGGRFEAGQTVIWSWPQGFYGYRCGHKHRVDCQNVLIYNTGTGTFNIAAAQYRDGYANLKDRHEVASAYKGILFFQDRNAAAATHTPLGGRRRRFHSWDYLSDQHVADHDEPRVPTINP